MGGLDPRRTSCGLPHPCKVPLAEHGAECWNKPGVLQDPLSLDAAVQDTLAGLFPPFGATAATVLGQLFRVLEATYGGDGLACLLDFLIPSKRLLEHVRQAACAPYCGRLFLHEGWPLCLCEKVVVHLGPLNPLLLRPGDFYLQAEPCGEQSARLAVKCLSRDLTAVDEIPVPEAACSLLFTREWLEEVNRGLGRPALHACLVATGDGIVPVPWSRIVAPEFVQGPRAEALAAHGSSGGPEICCPLSSPRQDCPLAAGEHGGPPGPVRAPPGRYPGLIKVEQGSWTRPGLFAVPSLCDIISENLEGEYVNLLGFSGEARPSFSASTEPAASATPARDPPGVAAPGAGKDLAGEKGGGEATAADWDCGAGPPSPGGPCTPCLRRRPVPEPEDHGPRCRNRESYVAALKNPVSFSSGLMAAILEEMDVAKRAAPPESASGPPPEGPGQAAPRIPPVHPEKDEKAEEASKPGPAAPPEAHAACPAAGNRFSLRKGPRQLPGPPAGLAAPEKAGKTQGGPRRRTPVACSPRSARAKPAAAAGKGAGPAEAAGVDRAVDDSAGSAADAQRGEHLPPGSDLRERVPWELLSPELLSSGVVCLPGSTDRLGRPVVQVCTSDGAWAAPWCSAREVTRLLLHLFSLARKQWGNTGLTVLIDARKEPPSPTLSAALGAVQSAWPGSIHTVLLLAEKEAAAHLEKLPGVQVELLGCLKALGRHVDSGQLTRALDGQFPYCHSEWVQFFQKLHRLVRDLTGASELLRSTTQELEQGEGLESVQAVAQRMERHRQLMQEVLRDARLVRLQREGGALLARLRKEAARLSSSPDVRSSIASALSLYNLVEEDVHTLVTKSNQRLEHLEFLLKIRELEEEFSKLSLWFDEQGEPELCVAEAAEGGREAVEEAYWRFKEFFKEATAHYSRGLSLSKDAARIQGSQFPEMEAFEAAKRAFQAKLTVFYMDMERRGAELETFLDLHRFCDQVTQFSLECERSLAAQSAGRKEAGSPGGRPAVERALQRLQGEFSPERFQQVKRQACSLRSPRGLAVWGAALASSREAKRLLDGALASLAGAPGGGPGGGGEGSGALHPDPRPGPPAPGDGPGPSLPAGHKAAEDSQGHEGGSVRPPGGGTSRDGAGGEEAPLGAPPECGVTNAPDVGREGSENSCRGPQSPPSTPPAPAAHPRAGRPPGGAGGLPCATPPCRSTPGRGPRPRQCEAAQYFQLARHGSFSSEDTDSQHSTDDAQGAPLPAEPPGPTGAQDRALGIVYLEKHSAGSPPHAAPQ